MSSIGSAILGIAAFLVTFSVLPGTCFLLLTRRKMSQRIAEARGKVKAIVTGCAMLAVTLAVAVLLREGFGLK